MNKAAGFYVPWCNIAEWMRVKEYLLSKELEQWKRACHIIEMWKLRFTALPVNIECTMGVLQVIVEDYALGLSLSVDPNGVLKRNAALVMEYSTALVRFVNHVSAECALRGDSLYLAALKSKIPDWVVNLRHDIAHSSSLPSLDLLRSAANFAIQWLLKNYWEPQDGNMLALDGNTIENIVSFDLSKLQRVLKSGITAWRQCCIAIREGRRFISLMTDEEWRSLTTFRKRLKKAQLVGGKELIDQLQRYLRKSELLRSGTEKKKQKGIMTYKLTKLTMEIMKLLTSSGPTLGKNLVDSLLQTDFLINEGSDWRRWKFVISLLDEADSLSYLIQCLLAKLAGEKEDETKQAAGWLNILSPSLEFLHQKYEKGSKEETADDFDEFPDDCIVLKIRRPPSITLEMLKPCLFNPTDVSTPVVDKYLHLLYPPLQPEFRSTVTQLLHLFTEQAVELEANMAADVEMMDVSNLIKSTPKPTVNGLPVASENEVTSNDNIGKWKKVNIDAEILKRCPLGILPGQVMPELDLSDLVWRFCPANRPTPVST